MSIRVYSKHQGRRFALYGSREQARFLLEALDHYLAVLVWDDDAEGVKVRETVEKVAQGLWGAINVEGEGERI